MENNNKVITVSVGVKIPDSPERLILKSTCLYYDITESELFSPIRTFMYFKRRAMLFLLLNLELQLHPSDIGGMFEKNRSTVLHALREIQVHIRIYPSTMHEYNSIKKIYLDLLQKQKEWLSQ